MSVMRWLFLIAVFSPAIMACNNTGETSNVASEKDLNRAKATVVAKIEERCGKP